MQMPDYYQILNLAPSTEDAELRKAIHRELRLWSNRTNAPQMERRQEAERMVKLIEEAERLLLDPQQRAEYDRQNLYTSPGGPPPIPSKPATATPSVEEETTPDQEEWRTYLDAGEYAKAIEILERHVREQPGNEDYQHALAFAYHAGMLSSWWEHDDKRYCTSEAQALAAKAILEKARALKFDDPELHKQIDDTGRLVDSMFTRRFQGSWIMVVVLGLCFIAPGVLWWWANRRPEYKINHDLRALVTRGKIGSLANALVNEFGDLEGAAYYSALPPGLRWCAYTLPRFVVWGLILLLAPFTFLFLIYDNYGPKYLLGAIGSLMLLLIILASSGGNSRPTYAAPTGNSVQTPFPPAVTQFPSPSKPTVGLPQVLSTGQFFVAKSTYSPDGRYGVTIPDVQYLADPDNSSDQNQLVEVETKRVLATIHGVTWWEDGTNHRVMNHGSLTPHWSADGSVLSWVVGGKWFPRTDILLKIRDGNLEWQLDVLNSVQREILAKTKSAVSRNYDAASNYNRQRGYGSAFPDGFTVDVATPEGSFSLPWQGKVTLDSNPKDDPSCPSNAVIRASLLATIQPDGSIVTSNYVVNVGKQTVDATLPTQNLHPRNDIAASSPAPSLDTRPVQPGLSPASFPGERYPETRSRLVTIDEIWNWNEAKLRYAANEVYARHGADFHDKAIKQWFSQFHWYHARTGVGYDTIESEFSDIERQNVKLLGDRRGSLHNKTAPVSPAKTSGPERAAGSWTGTLHCRSSNGPVFDVPMSFVIDGSVSTLTVDIGGMGTRVIPVRRSGETVTWIMPTPPGVSNPMVMKLDSSGRSATLSSNLTQSGRQLSTGNGTLYKQN